MIIITRVFVWSPQSMDLNYRSINRILPVLFLVSYITGFLKHLLHLLLQYLMRLQHEAAAMDKLLGQ